MRHWFLALWFLTTVSMADVLVYKQGDFIIQLMIKECPAGAMFDNVMMHGSLIGPNIAIIRNDFGTIDACWGLDIDTDVVIFDANGIGGYLPLAIFRQEKDI